MSTDNTLKLVDESLRDGVQSLWGMMMSHHMSEPVIGEIAEAGFDTIDLPVHVAQTVISARFFKEDPRETFRMWGEKLTNTKSNVMIAGMGASLGISAAAECKTVVRMFHQQFKEWVPQINQVLVICCTEDEVKNTYPMLFPMMRSLGIEVIPYLAIGHGPQHTPEFYATTTKEIVEKFKPISLCIKDVDGLLVPERARKIIAAMQAEAKGTPISMHLHGMNGLQTYNAVVGMEMGLRQFTTCIPPLANGSSHCSVFDIVKNVEEMGIPHNIDLKKCRIVEERLTKIGKAFGHPVDNHHLPFDLSLYKTQIPGGVISNTRTQLAQLGISDKFQEVMEEVPRILEDLGHPIMITPFSQFIVTQAVLNVQSGRWEECLDSCVEFAAGIYGQVESGVAYMNQNLKDKLLNLPQAKTIKKRAAKLVDYINSEPSEAECKAKVGLPPDATLEEYVLRYNFRGDEEMNNCIKGGPEFYKKYL
jgi:oxaloacetate decarboxylase alpha subunit